MLEQEFNFFLDHKDELYQQYPNKFIVIKGNEVLGAFNAEIDAYNETVKSHKLGTFLIQFCSPAGESYTHTFHSRAVFK